MAAPILANQSPDGIVGTEDRNGHDNNDEHRRCNENSGSHKSRLTDVLTISDGHSNILSRLSQRDKLEAILLGFILAWFFWKQFKRKPASKVNIAGKPRKRATVEDPGDPSLINDINNDATKIPIPIPPLTVPTTPTFDIKLSIPSPLNSNPNSPLPTLQDPEGGEKPPLLILTSSSPEPPTTPPLLIVSDTILGYGSYGTIVYEGSFQGRAVAVKRLLQDFVTLATREVSILQQSDYHPNVIRYYYQESHLDFFYIALELCPASLADIIENPHGSHKRAEEWRDIVQGFDAKRAIRQIASGLRHLHGLGLVHRDIKPQNILISSYSSGGGGGTRCRYRMLISDFGLCKKLDVDQTSFLPSANSAGTVGWRAPEVLRGDVKLDELSVGDYSTSSRGSVATVVTPTTPTTTKTRLTKSIDIFAFGCLVYYILTNGGHPYGDHFEQEGNIIKDNKQLCLLSQFCSPEESTEAHDLIASMLHPHPPQRPDIKTCLRHPFFWVPAKRLGFLQDASDSFEAMCKDPMDGALVRLETGAASVVGTDWHLMLDQIVIDNLGKHRKYNGKSVQDLIRAMRNKKHHYQDLPVKVRQHLGPLPEGFLEYFTRRYPKLFMHVHAAVIDTGLHIEPMFAPYFELPET